MALYESREAYHLRITSETNFEVVEVIGGAENARIRIDWLDQLIGAQGKRA